MELRSVPKGHSFSNAEIAFEWACEEISVSQQPRDNATRHDYEG